MNNRDIMVAGIQTLLERAKRDVAALESELAKYGLTNPVAVSAKTEKEISKVIVPRKRVFSEATRKKMADAQKKIWATRRSKKPPHKDEKAEK